MKLRPSPDSTTASICDESTSTGIANALGSTFRSISRASAPLSSFPSPTQCFCNRLSMMGERRIFSALLWMSFHITNLLNENSPNIDSSTMSHLGWSTKWLRTMANTFFTSMPCSSSGRGDKPVRLTSYCCFSISIRVVLKVTSSSRVRMT